jgi:Papain fold toxin 1, glutamine deamidase
MSERTRIRLPPNLRVNPGYPGRSVFTGLQGRNTNCGNCAVAIDNILAGGGLQRALPNPNPNRDGVFLFELEELYVNRHFFDIATADIEPLLLARGLDARGMVAGLTKSGGAHIFNVVNLGGKIVYIDGQIGRYTNLSAFTGLTLMMTYP